MLSALWWRLRSVRWLAPTWGRVHGAGLTLDALVGGGFVAIDLETTGLDPRRDVMVAVAAVPFIGGARSVGLVTLVAPGRPIPPASTAIHGITDAMVAAAPAPGSVLAALIARCADRVVVGHGVDFDLAVLAQALRAGGRPPLASVALDTRRLAAALFPAWPDFSLDAVAAGLGVRIIARHTAEGDAVAAGEVLLALVAECRRRGLTTLGEIVWLQDGHPAWR